MEKETIENFLRFKLNDNLKRFINEVRSINTKRDESICDLIRYINDSRYNVIVHEENNESICFSERRCIIDINKRIVTVTNMHPCLKSLKTFVITAEEILNHVVEFKNTLFGMSDETKLFEYIFRQDKSVPKYSYEFNSKAFHQIPKTRNSRLIIIGHMIFEVYSITPYAITLSDFTNDQKYYRTPIAILTNDVYPFHSLENLERTDDGLIIPALGSIIPICEYIGGDNKSCLI